MLYFWNRGIITLFAIVLHFISVAIIFLLLCREISDIENHWLLVIYTDFISIFCVHVHNQIGMYIANAC